MVIEVKYGKGKLTSQSELKDISEFSKDGTFHPLLKHWKTLNYIINQNI